MTGVKSLAHAPFHSELAACRGCDVNLFFPERGASVDAAKRVCMSCPVRAECLEFALVEVVKHGIFGGTSERERRRLRRERGISETRPRPPCGTTEGYSAHQRYGEDTCQACRDALAVYQLHRREELGRQFDPDAEHGSDSRYRSGCRCDECTIGQRVRTRRLHLVGES